jgi:hypothetical protein
MQQELAQLAAWRGRSDEAKRLYRLSYETYRQLGNPAAQALVLCGMAELASLSGNDVEARLLIRRSIACCPEPPADYETMLIVAQAEAFLADGVGDAADVDRLRSRLDSIGESNLRGRVWRTLGRMNAARGRIGESLSCLDNAWRIQRGLGERYELARTLDCCATAVVAAGSADLAVRLVAAGSRLRRAIDVARAPLDQRLADETLAAAGELIGADGVAALMDDAEHDSLESVAADWGTQALGDDPSRQPLT